MAAFATQALAYFFWIAIAYIILAGVAWAKIK